MADQPFNPDFPERIRYRRWSRNGLVVTPQPLANAANSLLHTFVMRRTPLFYKTGDLMSATHPTGPAGITGTTEWWTFKCNTGVGAQTIRILTLMMHNANSAGAYIEYDYFTPGGGTQTSDRGYAIKTAADEEFRPSLLTEIQIDIPCTEKTTYEFVLKCVGFARPLSCVAWEVADPTPDDANDGVATASAGIGIGNSVLDIEHDNIAQVAEELWRHNGSLLGCWTRASNVSSGFINVFENIFDGSTTITSDTAGWTVETTGHKRAGRDGMWVRFAARAVQTEASNPHVAFLDDVGATLARVDDFPTQGERWIIEDRLIPADGIYKIDIYAEDVDLSGVAAWEWDPRRKFPRSVPWWNDAFSITSPDAGLTCQEDTTTIVNGMIAGSNDLANTTSTPVYRVDGPDGEFAIGLNGTGESFDSASTTDYDPGTGDFSAFFSFYLPATPAGNRAIGGKREAAGGLPGWSVVVNSSGNITFVVSDGTSNFVTATPTLGTGWVDLLVTRSGATLDIYVAEYDSDTVTTATGGAVLKDVTNTANFRLGNMPGVAIGENDMRWRAVYYWDGTQLTAADFDEIRGR